MAITANFSESQTIGEPSILTLTDTSTGTDVTITQRRVYATKVDGNTLVEDGTTTAYEVWSGFPGTTTIDLDILDKDYALSVLVQWLTAGGTVVTSKTRLIAVRMYNDTFYYSLTQAQTSNPTLMTNKKYYGSKKKLSVELEAANSAMEFAGDQYATQACLDRATYLRLNSQLFL